MRKEQTSVAYLGEAYSFHFLAAEAYFGSEHNFISCTGFDAILSSVRSGVAQYGIIAIDNTLAGAVKGNIARIANSGLHICGEVYFRINLHLAAPEQVKMSEVETIYSHHMALKETSKFLSAFPAVRLIETSSTAGGLKYIAENDLKNAGAIGNRQAIEHYKLKMLAENIDNNTENRTRFFIVCDQKEQRSQTTFQNGKTSLLTQFYDRALNDDLPRLKQDDILYSHPLMLSDGEWLYNELNTGSSDEVNDLIRQLAEKGRECRVLGIYEKGRIEQ